MLVIIYICLPINNKTVIYFQIEMENLAHTNRFVATWNVHGALEGQEIHARNLLPKHVLDPDLQSWTLYTAGPATG